MNKKFVKKTEITCYLCEHVTVLNPYETDGTYCPKCDCTDIDVKTIKVAK